VEGQRTKVPRCHPDHHCPRLFGQLSFDKTPSASESALNEDCLGSMGIRLQPVLSAIGFGSAIPTEIPCPTADSLRMRILRSGLYIGWSGTKDF
jgi:hypothetical protein